MKPAVRWADRAANAHMAREVETSAPLATALACPGRAAARPRRRRASNRGAPRFLLGPAATLWLPSPSRRMTQPPSPHLPARPRAWTWLWLLLALALVVRTSVRERGVITAHLEFGRRLLSGQDLYAPYLEARPLHPPYPPSFGLLTAPFSLLPERAARVAWGLLQVGALL